MANDIPGGSVDLANGPVLLGNGIEGEPVTVPTANPTGFHQAISEPGRMPPTDIRGMLFTPRGDGPWPVVVVVPGSFGVAPSHVAKADHLTDAAIAYEILSNRHPDHQEAVRAFVEKRRPRFA